PRPVRFDPTAVLVSATDKPLRGGRRSSARPWQTPRAAVPKLGGRDEGCFAWAEQKHWRGSDPAGLGPFWQRGWSQGLTPSPPAAHSSVSNRSAWRKHNPFGLFPCSTAPQAFPRPDRATRRPSRAGVSRAGRVSAATRRRAWP